MPNWCGFSMMVQGHYDAVKEVQEIILKNHETNYLAGHKGEGEYCYNSVLRYDPKRKHMFRIFESRTPADFPEVDDNLIATQFIDGDCAWSVYCCMLPGEGSYYSDLGQLLYYGTNLVELSKDLGVRIEVFSEEPGMCFQEHYLIENGKLVLDRLNNKVFRRLNSLYAYLMNNNVIPVPDRETFAQRKRDLIDFNRLQLSIV